MSCDFQTVFKSLGMSLSTVANKPGVYDTVWTSFTKQMIENYPAKKKEIIAAAKYFNPDYEYVEEMGGKRRLTRRRRSRKQ